MKLYKVVAFQADCFLQSIEKITAEPLSQVQ